MYNLLVGFPEGTASGNRVFEYTDEVVQNVVAPGGGVDLSRLMALPTIVMPEVGFDEPQVARVGRIEDLVRVGSNYGFRFAPNPNVPDIATSRIQSAGSSLGIADFEFYRTHWAVKDVDLYKALWEIAVGPRPAPRVFRLPTDLPQEHDLVALMMPFDAGFAPVYDAFQEASQEAGFRCQRADDIWLHDHIMDDVASLIWRARVVVSDLTGKNANVFYETGIAHSIGRDVILASQSMEDIPFDLQSIRTVKYLPNREGLEQLKLRIHARLRDLATRT
jgi:hypothetical protein